MANRLRFLIWTGYGAAIAIGSHLMMATSLSTSVLFPIALVVFACLAAITVFLLYQVD